MVRGLALRSLCGLRLPSLAEYSLPAIRTALNDPSPYVRKNAVTGIQKIQQQETEAIKSKQTKNIAKTNNEED